MRAGLRTLIPRRAVGIAEELDAPEGLLEAVRATGATLVIAAPRDGDAKGCSARSTRSPPQCGAVVLLSVPGFRIQASALLHRFDIVCLPVTAGRGDLVAGIRLALSGTPPRTVLEEVVAGTRGTLSHREQEVLRELAQGKSNREIAEALWLAEDTIKSHLRRVYRKLGVGSRAEAVALYIGQLGRRLRPPRADRPRSRRRARRVASRSSCVPTPRRRPSWSTAIRPAERTVESRWATTSTVVRPSSSSTTSRSAASLAASSCEVASSSSSSRAAAAAHGRSRRAGARRPRASTPRCATSASRSPPRRSSSGSSRVRAIASRSSASLAPGAA